MVRKAVIAAAGRGTRFLPVTKAYPKELLPILDKPIIQILVEELIGAGIEKIAIVHRQGNSLIKQYFSFDPELEEYLKGANKESLLASLKEITKRVKQFRFLSQPRHLVYGTGAPVLAAKNFVGNEPFIYIYGDDLILETRPGQYLARLIKTYQKYQAQAVLGTQKVPWKEVEWYGTIRFNKTPQVPNQAEAIEEKLPADKAPSNFVMFGRFVVSSAIMAILEKQKPGLGNELLFTDALTTLAKENLVIAEPLKKEKWLTTGDPERWLATNQEFQKARGS